MRRYGQLDLRKEEKMENSGINRRSFLAGGAALGVAAMASGLTGCGKEGSTEQSSADSKSMGKYSFETPPAPIEESTISETVEADVVVVGAGLGGSFAAMAAAEEGASVIVLQKSPAPMTHGIGFGIFGAQVQKDAGMEFDLKGWAKYFSDTSCGYSEYEFCESFVYNSGPALDMLMNHVAEKGGDSYGRIITTAASYCKWDEDDVTFPYSRCPRMLEKMTEINEELGVKYYNSTPGEQLEIKDGRVVGVFAKKEDGTYLKAVGNKGVIIATGDIGNDPEMVAKYAPFNTKAWHTYLPPDNTGDGHKMMLWAGARMFTGPFVQAIHFDPPGIEGQPEAPFSGNPYLAVNAYGKRYQDENRPYQEIANLCLQQPGGRRWHIIDNTFQQYWMDFAPGMCRHQGFAYDTPEEAFDACLQNGAILKADTLEELADNIGFEGEAREQLFATIERYNELCDKGIDEDFGKDPEYLVKTAVKNPPFYSILRAPGPLALVDGVYVTGKMQVRDNEDEIIPGLFAVGNTVHGLYNVDYSINPGGTTTARAMTTGYVAGKAAIDALPDYKSYEKEFSGEGVWITPSAETTGTGADAGKTKK